MGNKIWFTLALIMIVSLHAFVLRRYKINQEIVTISPAKTISKTINLQRVAIKKPPPVVVEKIIVPPVIIKPPKIVKKPIKKKKKKIVKKKRIKKPTPKPEPKLIEEYVEIVEKVQEPIVQEPVSEPIAMISSSTIQDIQESYLSKLRAVIERHKRYPRSAKRLRQEGIVRVEFEIRKDGRIFHSRILEGSRYKKLNRATLKILEDIGAFAPIPKELGKNSWKINVPIAYKIIEN